MGNREATNDNDVIEIDLLQLFQALLRRWMVILGAMILFGGAVGAYSKFILTPQYQSTSMVYILSKETTLTSLADLQIGSQLTQDYKIIVTSRPVLEEVIEDLGLDLTYRKLKEKIAIDNPKDTRILSITATDPDPVMAKKITDTVAKVSSEYIGDIMEMVPPKIIEDGVIATEKSSPSNSKNAMLGALIGAFLVCGLTVLEVMLNDSIQSEDDVEKYLGLSVLASVPLREGEENEDRKEREKEKSIRQRRRKKEHKDKKINDKK